ncbi:hypothetical protein Tco_1400789 [Tanacetum coccineum]
MTLQIKLLRARPTTLGEALSLARITKTRFEDEWATTTIANPNDLNIAVSDQKLEESTLHTSDKVEALQTSRVVTYEEHGCQDGLKPESCFSTLKADEADNTKPPLFAETFGNNGGDDLESSGPVTPSEEVVSNGHSSTLFSLVEHGSSPDASASYGDGSAVPGSQMITGGSHVRMDVGLLIGIFSVSP